MLELSANPQQVVGGAANSTGTVWMNGLYSSAQTVTLSSSNPSKASVPSSISIPAFTGSGTFTITTAAVAATTDVTITATRNGDQDTFVVRLVP